MSERYRTIVADPPWAYRQPAWRHRQTSEAARRASVGEHYPTLKDDQIRALPVGDLIEDDAHLYLWVTNARIFDCDPVGIARAWGFTYKTLLTWNKTGPTGLGAYFRGRTEHVLFCIRGAAAIPPTIREQNIFSAVNGSHSTKPDCFYDMVERVSPGPYAELFGRRARFGWDYPIGDQALGGLAA